MLTFADPRIVSLVKQRFVAVTGDDWYLRRRNDPVGHFFRQLVDQTRLRGRSDVTFQGYYVFTASGRLLGYRNTGKNPDAMLRAFQEAWNGWEKLPDSERAPGAVSVPDLPAAELDQRYIRTPPVDGLVARVSSRILHRGESGAWQACDSQGARVPDMFVAQDHMWLRPDEWRSLVAHHADGEMAEVPSEIALRIARFHLVDNTRGEPDRWDLDQVRQLELTSTVLRTRGSVTRYVLRGSFVLATGEPWAAADRGYQGALLGVMDYDREQDRVERFELVARGDHWGQGRYTPGARSGLQPLGIYFELADGEGPDDSIAPQAIRSPDRYWHADQPL